MPGAVYGLLLGAMCAGGQQADTGQSQVQAATVELTNSRPEASFRVSPDTLANAPPVLALSFTRVVNPAKTPIQIFVYLSYLSAEKPSAAPIRILLGNVSLYPADRPSGYVVRASGAFGKLKAAKATDVRLVLEMKRIHPSEPWSQVEITVASPQWRDESASTRTSVFRPGGYGEGN